MHLDLHYVDPRLVAMYDTDNPRAAEADFYVRLASELGVHKILDFGCGTGSLTRELAIDGRVVIGVDPSPAMLAYARQQPGAERVQWIEGDCSALGRPQADLTIMTGNVAQVFLEEAEWNATLCAIHAALRLGGRLAFESRNPNANAWEGWNREATYERVDSPNGPMQCWLELVSVGNSRVSFEAHNVFESTGETLVVPSTLRFRSYEELTKSLTRAGFFVEHVYGNWNGDPFESNSRFMVFVASRSGSVGSKTVR